MSRSERGRTLVRLATSLAVGGSLFQLGNCDPAVRATVLTGLEQTTGTLLNTLNSAFYISIQDEGEDDTDTGTGTDGLTTT